MLQKSFTTLTQAVEYVDQRSKNQQLQKFIAEHRAHATTSNDVEVLPVEKREFDKQYQQPTPNANRQYIYIVHIVTIDLPNGTCQIPLNTLSTLSPG